MLGLGIVIGGLLIMTAPLWIWVVGPRLWVLVGGHRHEWHPTTSGRWIEQCSHCGRKRSTGVMG